MFVICYMSNGKHGPNLGTVLTAETLDEAIQTCFEMVQENEPVESQKEVMEEIVTNMGYGETFGDWSCHIGTVG